MEKLKAWFAAMASIGAPAADVIDQDDEAWSAQRQRIMNDANARLSEIRDRYPLEMGSRRFG